jgi:hypothetical protein
MYQKIHLIIIYLFPFIFQELAYVTHAMEFPYGGSKVCSLAWTKCHCTYNTIKMPHKPSFHFVVLLEL